MTLSAADRPDDGRFTVLASERHFTGPIFSVRVDTVTMPGGGSARRDIVDHMRAVAVVAVDERGNVVLIEQYRHPLRRRLWEIPAGLMDVPGEAPLDCARRELVEEVGLAAETWSVLVDFVSSPGYCTEAVRVYLATGLSAAERPPAEDEEADMRTVRVPLGEAVRAVTAGAIVDGSTVAGLLAAARALDGGPAAAATLRRADDPWTDSPALVAQGAVADAPAIATAAEGRPGEPAKAQASPSAHAGNSVIPEPSPER